MSKVRVAIWLLAALAACTPAIAATQAQINAAVSKVHKVAVLAGAKDTVYLAKTGLLTHDLGGETLFSIEDWKINEYIVQEATGLLSPRIAVVPAAYDPKPIADRLKLLGEVPRSTLPPVEGIDAYVVIWGGLRVLHTSVFFGAEQMESEVAYMIVDLIDAKTKKTLLRNELRSLPPAEYARIPGDMFPVRILPKEEYVEHAVIGPERREKMKGEFHDLLQKGLTYTFKQMKLAD